MAWKIFRKQAATDPHTEKVLAEQRQIMDVEGPSAGKVNELIHKPHYQGMQEAAELLAKRAAAEGLDPKIRKKAKNDALVCLAISWSLHGSDKEALDEIAHSCFSKGQDNSLTEEGHHERNHYEGLKDTLTPNAGQAISIRDAHVERTRQFMAKRLRSSYPDLKGLSL